MNKIMSKLIAIIFLFIPMSTIAAGKHALLIAIQDYSKTTFKSLNGPANDLKLTQGVLRERFGFVEDDFIILKDERATHSGIEKAFKALRERVKPNDFVYIFYSGHGSQSQDLNGDEPSGYDQTWVSYGARTRSDNKDKDNYDVLDDEIDKWLSNLYQKTKNVIFVSDSCHSATVARGAAAMSRAIEEDKRPHLLGKRLYQPLKTHYGIHIGAARDNESAIELAQKDDQYYGLFTWYWTQNLQQAQIGETWNDVFKRTYAQVTTERGMAQHPQIEGEHRRQVLAPGFSALSPTIPIIRIISKSRVKIKAGSLLGVTKGSVYRLYNSPKDSPRLKIYLVTPFASYAKAESKGNFKVGDLVVEESHAYHFTAFKVYLGADFDEDKPLLKEIVAAFATLSAYQLTDNPHQANLQLYLLRPFANQDGQLIYASPDDALPKSFPNQPPELWVLTPDQRLFKKGLKIPFDNKIEGLQLLEFKLKKMVRARELKALPSHRGSTLRVIVQTYLLSQITSCPKGANCVQLSDYGLGLHLKKGPYPLQNIEALSQNDLVSFSLHNQSEEDYYCYLIHIEPDDDIYTIFPSPDNTELALLKKGEKRKVMALLLMGESGENTIQVITSTVPIDISLLEQPRARSDSNPLKVEVDEWATGQVSFKVASE
ncbi:MAG: caspase family protein [Pseudomonadota bacterium]